MTGLLTMALAAFLVESAVGSWPQFGGPNRNFVAPATSIANSWPADGPKKLWSRSLGDGYSTVAVDGERLFTMYREAVRGEGDVLKPKDEEHLVCLDAKSGQTVWDFSYPAPKQEGQADGFGLGPNPTPLVVGDKVYSQGFTAKLHCVDKASGKLIWSHDLKAEFDAPMLMFGYAVSPIAYGDTIITLAGGDGAVIAFDKDNGTVKWRSLGLKSTYSSPILINYHGSDQLVILMDRDLVGLDPRNGELLWQHPTPQEGNIASPVWGDDDILFCSAAYDSGSRAVKLHQKEGKVVPEELWYTRKVRTHFGNSIRIGDYAYTSSGMDSVILFACVNVKTGEVMWRERGLPKSTLCLADGKLILLGEDGTLALAKVSPEKLEILSKCSISNSRCWAAPTIVGSTMYIRDRESIMAFDLG